MSNTIGVSSQIKSLSWQPHNSVAGAPVMGTERVDAITALDADRRVVWIIVYHFCVAQKTFPTTIHPCRNYLKATVVKEHIMLRSIRCACEDGEHRLPSMIRPFKRLSPGATAVAASASSMTVGNISMELTIVSPPPASICPRPHDCLQAYAHHLRTADPYRP